MATRTIKRPNEDELTLSSDELQDIDLVIAEVLFEITAETGSPSINVSVEELYRRVVAKGYDPETGTPIH
jgi:hypothetical protein